MDRKKTEGLELEQLLTKIFEMTKSMEIVTADIQELSKMFDDLIQIKHMLAGVMHAQVSDRNYIEAKLGKNDEA